MLTCITRPGGLWCFDTCWVMPFQFILVNIYKWILQTVKSSWKAHWKQIEMCYLVNVKVPLYLFRCPLMYTNIKIKTFICGFLICLFNQCISQINHEPCDFFYGLLLSSHIVCMYVPVSELGWHLTGFLVSRWGLEISWNYNGSPGFRDQFPWQK